MDADACGADAATSQPRANCSSGRRYQVTFPVGSYLRPSASICGKNPCHLWPAPLGVGTGSPLRGRSRFGEGPPSWNGRVRSSAQADQGRPNCGQGWTAYAESIRLSSVRALAILGTVWKPSLPSETKRLPRNTHKHAHRFCYPLPSAGWLWQLCRRLVRVAPSSGPPALNTF